MSNPTAGVTTPLPQLGALPRGWLGVQLQRLDRLLALQDAHGPDLNGNGRQLLHHAIFATYVECRDLGGAEVAASILRQYGEGDDGEVDLPAPPEPRTD